MVETNELKASLRENVGKSSARSSRNEGLVPCIVYGNKKDPISVNINYIEASKLYNTGRMLTTLLDLELTNGETIKVIPKEIQVDPIKDTLIHVDMLRLAVDARVSVEIQVNFIDEDDSPGVKRGGVLNVSRYTIELDCPATEIPSSIDVSIAGLEIGESVHLSDIKLPEGVVSTITDRDITIASITAPIQEEEPEVIEEEGEGEEGEEGEEESGVDDEDKSNENTEKTKEEDNKE